MKRIGLFFGKIIFWLSLPALWFILSSSKRTRMLIICNDEFLVLKGWLNNGKYSLPGGGIHRRENSKFGVIREVKEETGLNIMPDKIKYFYQDVAINNFIKFNYDCYYAEFDKKPEIKLQKLEIADFKWIKFSDSNINLSADTFQAVNKWLNK